VGSAKNLFGSLPFSLRSFYFFFNEFLAIYKTKNQSERRALKPLGNIYQDISRDGGSDK
jgi:hypothetical protein